LAFFGIFIYHNTTTFYTNTDLILVVRDEKTEGLYASLAHTHQATLIYRYGTQFQHYSSETFDLKYSAKDVHPGHTQVMALNYHHPICKTLDRFDTSFYKLLILR
jgi:hypothetical protein